MRQVFVTLLFSLATQAFAATPLLVLKSPTCGCCEGWMEHLNESGFSTRYEHPTDLNQRKAELSIAPQYQSCHTGITEQGFIFEGHVPAKFIAAFIDNPPAGAIGLAVPAMPIGTPGMEMGERFTPYTIWALQQDGSAQPYAQVASAAEQF